MALTTIKAAAMAANSVDSDQYVDGSIDNAHIADNAVGVDELADAINTDIAAKAPIAGPTFTGTVAIPNIANLETAVAANTAKVTNATHTGDVTGATALTIAAGAVTSAKLDTNIAVTGTVSDSKGDLRKVIQNTQGSTYTLVAADAGKHILASGTVTIPDSVFAAGDAVTIVNNTGSDLTITKTITTMYMSTDASSANRTLATRGMATILFASGTVAYISGAGLS